MFFEQTFTLLRGWRVFLYSTWLTFLVHPSVIDWNPKKGVAAAGNDKLCILPIGDSITQGVGVASNSGLHSRYQNLQCHPGNTSWRYFSLFAESFSAHNLRASWTLFGTSWTASFLCSREWRCAEDHWKGLHITRLRPQE